ncbi:TetR/AcrR family transcriptional regulator [Vibrio harveyi]
MTKETLLIQAQDSNSMLQKSGKVTTKYMTAKERETYIVKRAIECFARDGFGVTTRELAKNIGVTQPLIYRYFGSKEALIERVHHEVFVSRWNPQWEISLSDQKQPIEERLINYLEEYTSAILRNDWVRLFIFTALSNPEFNKNYTQLLKEKIFVPILSEIRVAHGLDPAPSEIDIEIIWGFHSSFFYMGIRRWIYLMQLPENINTIIRARVKHFLYGYHALLESSS